MMPIFLTRNQSSHRYGSYQKYSVIEIYTIFVHKYINLHIGLKCVSDISFGTLVLSAYVFVDIEINGNIFMFLLQVLNFHKDVNGKSNGAVAAGEDQNGGATVHTAGEKSGGRKETQSSKACIIQ